MKLLVRVSLLSCFVLIATPTWAQHCAPIYESFLSRISIRQSPKHHALDLSVEYSKHGGRRKEKYQIYLLAYLQRDKHRVPAPLPADLIDKRAALVLKTEAVQRNKDGNYQLDARLDINELAGKIIELGQLTEKDRQVNGGWGYYKEEFRLAVFVPFLEDRKYSVLPDLPEDKHECNYTDDRALLFQPLPYSFSICFGIVQAYRLPEGKYHIEINQAEPAAKPEGPEEPDESEEPQEDEPKPAAQPAAEGSDNVSDQGVPDEISRHMSEDDFWLLIDLSREASGGDMKRQTTALRALLKTRTREEIEAFDWHFRRLHFQASTWDLWGVVYIINGGCGDDSFHYFRTWLISRGRAIYAACLKDPQRLRDIPGVKNCFFELLKYVPAQVCESRFGESLRSGPPIPGSAGPSGVRFSEEPEDLKKRFPKVWEKFGEDEP